MIEALCTMLGTLKVRIYREWRKEQAHINRARMKKRYWYIFYCRCVVFLWTLLAISLSCEALTGSSVTAHLLHIQTLPVILNVNAVRRTAETVGFGSILIAWLYAALDKEELGFKYSDLLRAVYPTYSRFVIGHLIAMLLCVWLSESGMLEGALLSLAVIVMGGFIHWRALSSLVFKSYRRKRIAIDEWSREIEEWDERKEGEEDLERHHQSVLCGIADVLSIHDRDSAQEMQRCFARALCKFTDGFVCDKKAAQDYCWKKVQQQMQVLSEISHLWDRAARGRTEGERSLMLDGILRACLEETAERGGGRAEALMGPVCAGCVLWLYKSCAGAEVEDATLQETRLLRLRKELDAIRARFCGRAGDLVIRYIDEVFTLLAWMHFLNGESHLLGKFFVFSPDWEMRDDFLLQAVAGCAFPIPVCRANFETALQQTFVPAKRQEKTAEQNGGKIA